jgi:hypothetical protein
MLAAELNMIWEIKIQSLPESFTPGVSTMQPAIQQSAIKQLLILYGSDSDLFFNFEPRKRM